MRPTRYEAKSIIKLFRRLKIAEMAELKQALGTTAHMTVVRKLKQLSYHSSYSHGGRYYTLDEVAQFDAIGLWSFRSVWFSKHGTLIATAQACVDTSEGGYFVDELEAVLHVRVNDVLRQLEQEGRVAREKVSRRYLYCSSDPAVKRRQLASRKIHEADASLITIGTGLRILPDELQAAIILFYSLLDERQRRLYAGLESMKLGHGGDTKIAALLGLDVATVAKGRRQLLDQDVEMDRVRKAGAGRLPVEKKRRK